jgi:hypothetical protein
MKVVQNLVGHNSSLGWHFKFGVEGVQICKSNLFSLFTRAMKISILAFKFLSRFKLKSYSACAII